MKCGIVTVYLPVSDSKRFEVAARDQKRWSVALLTYIQQFEDLFTKRIR